MTSALVIIVLWVVCAGCCHMTTSLYMHCIEHFCAFLLFGQINMFALCIANITFPIMSSNTKVHRFLDQLTSEAGIAFAAPKLGKRVTEITEFIKTYQSNLEQLFGRPEMPEMRTYEDFMEVLCDTSEQSFVDYGMPERQSRFFRNLCRAIAHKQNMNEFDDVIAMEEPVKVQGPDPDDVLSFGSSVHSEPDIVPSVSSVKSYDSDDSSEGGKKRKRKRTHRRKCKGSKRRKSRRRHRHRTRRSKH